VAGVFQRCQADCPPNECSKHTWSYTVELPARPNGKRRQITKAGFLSGKKAMEARQDLAKRHRDGNLPDDMGMTVARYLPEYIEGKIQRREIEGDTTATSYRGLARYLLDQLGHRKLSELRGLDLTRAYANIVADRNAVRAAAEALNEQYAAEATAEKPAGRSPAGGAW
jgi:Arm DNA-binding domain